VNSELETLTVINWHVRGDPLWFAPPSQQWRSDQFLPVRMDSLKGCPDGVASPHIFAQLAANRGVRTASKTYLPCRKITVSVRL